MGIRRLHMTAIPRICLCADVRVMLRVFSHHLGLDRRDPRRATESRISAEDVRSSQAYYSTSVCLATIVASGLTHFMWQPCVYAGISLANRTHLYYQEKEERERRKRRRKEKGERRKDRHRRRVQFNVGEQNSTAQRGSPRHQCGRQALSQRVFYE